jgi:hypothetical protein
MLLAVFWVVYAGMVVALIVGRDINLLIIVGCWTFILPWITWSFLSGVRVVPGRSVGGGPMYPRVGLEPDEQLLFQAPAVIDYTGGHLFVTDRRLIALSFRRARTVRLSDIVAVEDESKGIGWPLPRRSVRVTLSRGSLVLRPWGAPRVAGRRFATFMGLMDGDEFVETLLSALGEAGGSDHRPAV